MPVYGPGRSNRRFKMRLNQVQICMLGQTILKFTKGTTLVCRNGKRERVVLNQ